MASSTDTNAGALKRKRNFFNDEELSDVIIKFGEKQVFAHKVILASGSIWFEKALLGNFSEAKKKVIDLGTEDDPDALIAMLKHQYGYGFACQDVPDERSEDCVNYYLNVYKLADFYDVDALGTDVVQSIKEHLTSDIGFCGTKYGLYEETIFGMQRVLGPEAVQYADKLLLSTMKEFVLQWAKELMHEKKFVQELALGKMFDKEFGIVFLNK
ncbi:hypothetical protein D6C89_08913, partial [Aureobasidium pullulans]